MNNKIFKNKKGFTQLVDFCDAISSRTKGASQKLTTGFTIIEMMIAIALFLVIVIYGMQALLNANSIHRKSQDMRSIMDSLTFALDDMSKNIRVGYDYHCINSDFNNLDEPKSCKDGIGIAFESSTGDITTPDDQWIYFIGENKLWKSSQGSCGQDCAIQLTPDEVVVKDISGFDILGAESPLDNDKQQPLVIIRLIGTIERNNNSTPFSIETAVSQRLIDVAFQINPNIIISPTGSVEAEAQAVEAQSAELQEAQSVEQASPQSAEAAP